MDERVYVADHGCDRCTVRPVSPGVRQISLGHLWLLTSRIAVARLVERSRLGAEEVLDARPKGHESSPGSKVRSCDDSDDMSDSM